MYRPTPATPRPLWPVASSTWLGPALTPGLTPSPSLGSPSHTTWGGRGRVGAPSCSWVVDRLRSWLLTFVLEVCCLGRGVLLSAAFPVLGCPVLSLLSWRFPPARRA